MDKLRDYTNGSAPIVAKRIKQYHSLNSSDTEETKEIFYSIPKNYRKIFLKDYTYDDALKSAGGITELSNKMKKCILELIEVIG